MSNALPTLPARSFALSCVCCLETPEQTFACADGARCCECAAVSKGAEVFGEWFGEDTEHALLVTEIANAIEEGYESDLHAAFVSRTARAYLAYEVKADRRAPKSGLAITPAEWRAYRLARTRKAIALLRAMPKAAPVATHNPGCGDVRCPHCKPTLAPVPSVAECWDALVASMAADGRRAA